MKKSAKNREPCARTILQKRRGEPRPIFKFRFVMSPSLLDWKSQNAETDIFVLLLDMCRSDYSIMKGCSTFLSSLCVIGKQHRSTTTITVYKHRKQKQLRNLIPGYGPGTLLSAFRTPFSCERECEKTIALCPNNLTKKKGEPRPILKCLFFSGNYKILYFRNFCWVGGAPGPLGGLLEAQRAQK